MVLGQHRRMWLEAMRQTEQRVYGFGILKDVYALVGIHLRKQKCCLKKGTTSFCQAQPLRKPHSPADMDTGGGSLCLSDFSRIHTKFPTCLHDYCNTCKSGT